MSSPKQELREALGALEDAIAQADWPLVRLCFTRARAEVVRLFKEAKRGLP